MTPAPRLKPRLWILALVCSLGFVTWADVIRERRVEFISNFSAKEAVVDAASASGYADGKRWLIVPEHNNPTYQWIEETQQMIARHEWRVRSVDYENAPYGRSVESASPYRWWLVLVAWIGHLISGKTVALCVERAALYADPAAHLACLLGGTVFVARRFGTLAAVLHAVLMAAVFPLAAAFLPGVANDFGAGQVLALWSVLLVVAGAMDPAGKLGWIRAAGIVAGCGLWISASVEAPIIAGLAAGAVLAEILAVARNGAGLGPDAMRERWRAWALAGALTSLGAYLVEFCPGHMDLQLRVNYPLYGIAWLGLGELAWRIPAVLSRGGVPKGARAFAGLALSALATASLPAALIHEKAAGFLADDPLSTRLANLPGGIDEPDLWSWVARGGGKGALLAALLPVLAVGLSVWVVSRRRTGALRRSAVSAALVPALAALGLGVFRIRWFSTFDAVLIPLVVAGTAGAELAAPEKWAWSAAAAVSCAFGLVQLAPSSVEGPGVIRLTRAELEGLYERDLAHWLADHAEPDHRTVLCPPFRTSSLCFYGGLRGLASENWENKEGLVAASHIATAMRRDESLVVVQERGVDYIILPSWDTDLEELARLNLKYPESSFVYALHRLYGGGFTWLRPVPYDVPPVAGLKPESVLLLQVTDPADPATVQSRIVEYLLEMRENERAAAAGAELLNFPANMGAQVALAQLAGVRGDPAGFRREFRMIVSEVATGADSRLAWDRRVSLAVVLSLGGRPDLSREQVRRCMEGATEEGIRSLTTESLYHLLILGKRDGYSLPDPSLRGLALKLLPEEARANL